MTRLNQWIVAAVLALVATTPAAGQQPVLFREAFETPGANGQYGFPYKYPENGHWTVEHVPDGGHDGRGAAKITMRAGHTQYSFGWAMTTLGRTFTMGDSFYLRFRIKFNECMRANEGWGNKFVMMGVPGTSPNSRFILYMSPPSGNSGCTLGMRAPNDGPWAYPAHYGITGFNSFSQSPLQQDSWSVSPKVNIGWDCAPPIYFTRPSNSRNATPGSNSARPSNGWYHVQVYVQSGQPGQGAFKTWANNNGFSTPTSQKIGLTEGLGVQDWNRGATIGGYMDTATPSVDLGYTIDDVELGTTFDPSWYPSGSAPPPPPPTPVDCAGTFAWTRIDGSETACVAGTRTFLEQRLFTVVTPPSNGGAACPSSPESRTATEACTMPPPPPPVLGLTATGSTRTCTLVATADRPPDTATGWGVQFARRLAGDDAWVNHGTRDTAAPYTRSAAVALGQWEVRAVWSRTGATPVTVGTLAVWSCEP